MLYLGVTVSIYCRIIVQWESSLLCEYDESDDIHGAHVTDVCIIVSAGHSSNRTPLYFCKYERDDMLPVLFPVRLLIRISLGNDLLKCICSAMQKEPTRRIYVVELIHQESGKCFVVHREFGETHIISEEEYKDYSILVHA